MIANCKFAKDSAGSGSDSGTPNGMYRTVVAKYAGGLMLCAVLMAPAWATSASVKIATWNIEHLNETQERCEEDYALLWDYAKALNADIVALQEIGDEHFLGRVFDPHDYSFFISTRSHIQKTAFAVKKAHTVTQYGDYADLNITGHLRHGVDIAVEIGGQSIRFLSVHLKSGCFKGGDLAGPISDKPATACEKLAKQIPELEKWIDARANEEAPFVVMGDFNRRLNLPDDQFWTGINDGDPNGLMLHRATEGKKSGCWKGSNSTKYRHYPEYIDHIVYGSKVKEWIEVDSFEQIVYEQKHSDKELSDHCPISVRLDVH